MELTQSPIESDESDESKTNERRKVNVQGWLKVLILFGLAIYFAVIIVTGDITNYVNITESFGWLSYVAVVLFAGLGLAALTNINKRDDTATGYGHISEPSWSVLLIVGAPLVLGTLIPSQPLGAEAINGNLTTTGSGLGGLNTFTADPLDRNILDWLRVFNSEPAAAALDGTPADVIGFVYREPGLESDQFMVARFALSCCVADASAFALPVMWADTSQLSEGEWVRVRGEFNAGDFRGETLPILIPQTVDSVEQPEHPYLYP